MPGEIKIQDGITYYTPLVTQVINLESNKSNLDIALPGGFIAIETTIDPCFAKANYSVRQIVLKVNSLDDLLNLNCKIIDNVTVINVNMLSDETLILNNSYIIVVHASEHSAKLINISPDGSSCVFKLNQPIVTFDNEKVAILMKDGPSINMIGYAFINLENEEVTHIKMRIDNDDINDFFQNLPIDKTVNNVVIDSEDLKLLDISHLFPDSDLKWFDEDNELKEKYSIDSLLQCIPFEKVKYAINTGSIETTRTTTSLSIKNAKELFSNFTNDNDKYIKLAYEFGELIKAVTPDGLTKATIQVSNGELNFNNCRKLNKILFNNDLNKLFDGFIEKHFTCQNCKNIGSLFMEKKKYYCRACKAVVSESR